jgi:CheY-like chemotaxis protein/two-component sensor histidine kinase
MAGKADPTAESVREMMERQVGHMVRLVDDLLDVSRITRGRIELRTEAVDLAAVVRSALETSRPLIEAAGHRLTVAVPDEPLPLQADPVRLAQVIANLLNNAAKYTEEGGQIWLTARREGDEGVVSVRDTGLGIPADMLPRVFDMFAQVNRTLKRAQGGLGIGLTLSRNLVELHGGTLSASSPGPGQGSEFTMRLPLARAGRQAPEAVRPDEGQPSAGPARRILIVDDNRDAAEALGLLLQFLGNEVRVVHDGPSALEAAGAYRPAVVFLDIGMPGMDGYAVARELRARAEHDELVLIALTGWGQEEDRLRSRAAGFDHHLIKPVDLDALQALLASCEAGRCPAALS